MEKLGRDNEETNSKINTHQQIQTMIDDLLELEKSLPLFDLPASEMILGENQTEDASEEQGFATISDGNLESEPEITKKGLKIKHKKLFSLKIKRRKSATDKEISEKKYLTFKPKELKPTEFMVGFDENGNLVNLDLRKPKIKEKSVSKLGKINILKKIKSRKKGEKSVGSSSDDKSKGSKIKGVFGKVAKLKNAIPGKGKKEKKEKK